MSTKEINTTKKSGLLPGPSLGGLLSFDEFDHLLSRRWPRVLDWNLPTFSEINHPRVDIIDHDNEIEVQAALPGIKKEDLEVSIQNQTITIRASTKEKKEQEKGNYFRREITRGEFQRALSLPEKVNEDKAVASFKDGILKVIIPKTEKVKAKAKSIKVN